MSHGKDLLIEGIRELGLEITENQIEQFMKYYELLIETNKVMNLTAITEQDEVMVKHFIDSLLIVRSVNLQNVDSVIDVGTGAGFPGIPMKIMFPHLKVTLLDSLNKRLKFLNEVIEALALDNVTTVHGRAEDLGHQAEHREQYDLCVSRAVANLATLSEYCIPFIKVGGMFASYKALDSEEEISKSKKAVQVLGGDISKKDRVHLPCSDVERMIVCIDKVKHTGKKYPRKAGTPAKEPIR